MPEKTSTQPAGSRRVSLWSFFAPRNGSLLVLAALIAYAAVRNICQAATKSLWYDELCTFLMVRQRGLSALWRALKDGADGQPPAFYLIEKIPAALISNENISFRILSIVGFSATVLCLYFLIRRRRGSGMALLCAAIPFVTVLFDTYAVESRPYSLVVACVAFAMVCYERAPARNWMFLFACSLVLAESFHYLAVLAFVPFFVAEGAYLLNRKFRWPVWMALGCGVLPLLAFWPLLSRSKAIFGEHFWSMPSLEMAETSYGWYLRASYPVGVFLAAAAAVAVMITLLFRSRRVEPPGKLAPAVLQEPVLILSLLALPFVGVFATEMAHSGMTAKYVLSAILGFPLALSYVLPRLSRNAVTVLISFFLLLLLPQETLFWKSYRNHFSSPADAVESFVNSAGHPDLPVVVSDAHEFMPLAHYASPEWKARFVSVVDAPQAVIYTGSDTGDKELPILAAYAPLNVYEFQTFAAQHPEFLLYSNHGGMEGDWWPRKLRADGYTLQPVAVKPRSEHDFFHRVFLVSRKKDAD